MDNKKLVESFLKTFAYFFIAILLILGICLFICLAKLNVVAFYSITLGLLFIVVWVLTYHYM